LVCLAQSDNCKSRSTIWLNLAGAIAPVNRSISPLLMKNRSAANSSE
jgi:hypothetical protein